VPRLVICEQTAKANPGGVAGGAGAVLGIVLGCLVAATAWNLFERTHGFGGGAP
jgi:hypothetical protein